MNLQHASGWAALLMGCLVKATILLAVAWILTMAARRSSASFRHLLWAAAILACLILPLLTIALPAWHASAPSTGPALGSSPYSVEPHTRLEDLSAMAIDAAVTVPITKMGVAALLSVWFPGFLYLAARMLAGLVRLRRIRARSGPLEEASWIETTALFSRSLEIGRPVRLLLSRNPAAMPMTWGVFRPVVLLPAAAKGWQELRRRVVLTHELAHVARCDWLFTICAEIACAVYWFHPLVWLAARKLRQESERASDDAVLQTGVPAPDYAHQLLELAGALNSPGRAWFAALALARQSHMERRFSAMLNPSLHRRALSPRSRTIAYAMAFLLLVPLAAFRLPGQSLAGRFSGAIFDPSGAAVPNATVIMTDRKTHKITMTTSDGQGRFTFTTLTAGQYELKAVKRGFEDYQAPQVLEAGREASHDLNLKVAAVTFEDDVVPQGTAKGLPPSEPGGKTTRVRVGGDLQAPKLVNKVQPVYPEAAKAAGSQGTVILHAVIGTDGTPLSLRVVNDQIDPRLARSAIESVSKWRYTPTLLNGEPIEVDTTIQVNFTLQQ